MGCASKQNQHGFTLVEISIVMIIIGLLIGGTFGGMKLIENMQVNKTVQDLKAIESAALTFKDTYGRLPGDMPNTAARLPNCSVAPCATGGNGNRIIENTASWSEALVPTMEKFTFWHHLQASDMLSVGTKNTLDMNFGEGQPESAVGGGFRLYYWPNGAMFNPLSTPVNGTAVMTTVIHSDVITATNTPASVPCGQLASIDRKIDDGRTYMGEFFAMGTCSNGVGPVTEWTYLATGEGNGYYDLKGF
jgi:prepilin-type N-terminal cleavage/methylation domain-containing protein